MKSSTMNRTIGTGRMTRPMAGTVMLSACLTVGSCGLAESKYVDYSDEQEDTGDLNDPCVQEAIALFGSHVEPAIDSSCSLGSCHGGFVPTLVLTKGNNAANRTAILKYMGSDGNRLSNKIGPGGQHTGGDLSSVLPKASIDAWFAKEQECKG